MYTIVKKILTRVINKQQLQKYEVTLRRGYAVLYSGTTHQCTVCKKKLRTFIPIAHLSHNDLLCPGCGSLSRDRRLWLVIQDGFMTPGITVLDFSPSRCLSRKMSLVKDINYLSTDLSGNFIADFAYDITAIDRPDNSVDLIICYHVLEHIPDDAKAMAELFRILKPGGKAIIQTPFKEGDTYEDFSITLPAQREIHFGQDDHVRIYSVQGLSSRLKKAGFDVKATNFDADTHYGLSANEHVFTLTKP